MNADISTEYLPRLATFGCHKQMQNRTMNNFVATYMIREESTT